MASAVDARPFAYGRGGRRLPLLLVAAPAGGAGPGRPNSATPHPAALFEDFVLGTLRASGRGVHDADWRTLGPALDRVEVRARDTHLVVEPG